MAMSRKDYRLLAKTLRDIGLERGVLRDIVNDICRAFTLAYPNFDQDKFYEACEVD